MPSVSFPCWDRFINALLQSDRKHIKLSLEICSSMVSEHIRLKIPHSLNRPQSAFYKVRGCFTWDLLSLYNYLNYIMATKTC